MASPRLSKRKNERTATADSGTLLRLLLLRPLRLGLLDELLFPVVLGVVVCRPVCAADRLLVVDTVDDTEAKSGPAEDLQQKFSNNGA